MKALWYVSYVLTAATVGLLSVSPASAATWPWQRDAGAKIRGEVGVTGPREARVSSYPGTYRTYRPGAESCPDSLGQPAPAGSVRAGQRVIIARDGVAMMRGRQVVATLTRGEEIVVSRAHSQWLGTSTDVDGSQVFGWVPTGSVIPVAQAGGHTHALVLTPVAK